MMTVGVMESSTFGAWLARQLVTHGYRSQRAFARAIDMDPTYLSRILNGHVARPERETLERIAERLRLPYAEVAQAAGALPDAVMPPARLAAPEVEDKAWDAAALVPFVLNHPDKAFVARLERLAERVPPEAFERICQKIAVAWLSNGVLAVETAEEFIDLDQ